MNQSFSISQVITQSWKLIKTNYKFIVPAILASTFILGVIQYLTMKTEDTFIPSLIVTVISIVVSLALSIGWTNVIFKLMRGSSKKWQDFKTDAKIWGKVFLGQLLITIPAMIVFGIIIVLTIFLQSTLLGILGVIFGIIALVYISVRFMFLTAVAVDHPELGVIALIKKVAKITRGYFFDLLGFSFVMFLLILGGLLLVGVGLFIAIPLTMIAQLFVYEKIHGESMKNN